MRRQRGCWMSRSSSDQITINIGGLRFRDRSTAKLRRPVLVKEIATIWKIFLALAKEHERR